MNYITTALNIAVAKHGTQLDKVGQPFVMHPIRVAVHLGPDTDPEIIAAALLHDIVEDTDLTLDNLRGFGLSDRIVRIVDALTRREDETYRQYIVRVGEDAEACKVKLADLKDNMDIRRGTTPEILSLIKNRYIWAKGYLFRLDQEREMRKVFSDE